MEQIEIKMVDMSVLSLRPGDVVVLRCGGKISDNLYAILKETIKPHFPNNKVIILEQGMEISVLRDDSTDGTE
jgi:hypothetical protein